MRKRMKAISTFPKEILIPEEAAALRGLSVGEQLEKARRVEIQAAAVGRQWGSGANG